LYGDLFAFYRYFKQDVLKLKFLYCTHEKNNFAEVTKNLVKHRSENDIDELSK